MLERNWGAVEETANALIEHETLSGVALDALLSTVQHMPIDSINGVRARRPPPQVRPEPMRRLAAILLSALVAALSAGGASAEPTWRLEQPAPPPGTSFAVPLGPPGDLQFLAPNHGLLAVSGNATVPTGLYFYDGVEWHQLSTVCGGPGRTTRIAIASPREFWTITLPSRPRAQTDGTALCRFLDGKVVASYSTPLQSPDPFREMTAAACTGPRTAGSAGSAPRTRPASGAARSTCTGTARPCARCTRRRAAA